MVSFGREIYTRELPSVDPFEEINGSHLIEVTCLYVSLSSEIFSLETMGSATSCRGNFLCFKSMGLGQTEDIN